MKSIKTQLFCLSLVPLGLLLNFLFSLCPFYWERWYSLKFNKFFIERMSRLIGYFPFSLFEILVYISILSILIYILHTLWKVFLTPHSKGKLLISFFINSAAIFSVIYFIAVLLWNLNYNRPSIGEVLPNFRPTHTQTELSELYSYLINETNLLRNQVEEDSTGIMTLNASYLDVFKRAQLGYNEALCYFPNLSGNYGLPKRILTSPILNYTGITGIYSPFTAEANVSTAIPDFWLPSTTTHEMAHQRGYAHEDEANFIAFVTCILHPDADFKYSGYFLALVHTRTALQKVNPILLQELNQSLSSKVLADLRYNNTFWGHYEGPIDSISSFVNDTYLKANGVPDGEESYGRMVDLLIDYYNAYLK